MKSRIFEDLVPGRCWLLYAGLMLTTAALFNCDKALTQRMNFLKQGEADVFEYSAGNAVFNRGAFIMAARYYTELLKYHPRDGVIYGNRGFCEYYLGGEFQAVSDYQKAVTMEPGLGSLQWDLALIYFRQGHIREASRIWERYMNNFPAMRKYYGQLKDRLNAQKNIAAAFKLELLLRKMEQDERLTHIKLGESYFLLNDFVRSGAITLAGHKKFPSDRRLDYIAGLSLFKQRNFRQAAFFFEEAIRIDPNDMMSYYYHGLCMDQLGQHQEFLRDVLRLNSLRKQGVVPLPFPENSELLHLNTELLMVKYQLPSP